MRAESTYQEFVLHNGEALSLPPAAGGEVRCVRGRVWLTEENGNDVTLLCGQRHTLGRPGRTVVEPVGRSGEVCLRLYPATRTGGLLTRTRRWLTGVDGNRRPSFS